MSTNSVTNPGPVAAGPGPQESRERLVHELRVHQVELEAQNRDLRDAQFAVEASRNRYVELYDFAPLAYFTFDLQGCVRELNLAATNLVGRDRATVVGVPFLALVQMQDPALFWGHLRQASQTNARVTAELSFTAGPQRPFVVLATSTGVADGSGRVSAVRTAFVDVSAQRRAEAERERALASERAVSARLERVDGAMSAVHEALARVRGSDSLAGVLQLVVDQARALVDASFAAFGVAGRKPNQPFSQWIFSGVDPAWASAMGSAPPPSMVLGGALAGPHTVRLDDVRQHRAFRGLPDQHPTVTSILSVPVRHGDKMLGSLLLGNRRGGVPFSEDDQRSAEMLASRVAVAMEIAQLYDTATAAVRSRDNLLAIVSHDLRNLLSVVSMKVAQLTRHRPRLERRNAWEHAEVIQHSMDRMGRLVQDLLQASSIESGTFAVELRPEDAAQIVDECLTLLAPAAAAAGIRLEREVGSALPPVQCDRDRVVQVLSNLVSNALKFTPRGGTVRVAVTAGAGQLRFAVSDTGPGISRDEQPQLFDRYWKGRSSGKKGTGLGLYIARGIVLAHGGELWVESNPGAGSTFSFTLAEGLAGPEARPSPGSFSPPPGATRLHGLRALVVDDEEGAASALSSLLRDEGLVVEAATSGADALQLVEALRPEVAVLDVEMPGMSGLALLAALRERYPGLPAIVMSGYLQENADVQRALKLGAVGYVSKPIDVDRLLGALAALFPQQGRVEPRA